MTPRSPLLLAAVGGLLMPQGGDDTTWAKLATTVRAIGDNASVDDKLMALFTRI